MITRRPTTLAAALVVALALGGPAPAGAAASSHPPHWQRAHPCPDVFVVGARGSGESRAEGGADAHRGFGPRAVAVLGALSDDLTARGIRVAPVSVDYPAIAVDEAARNLFDMQAEGFGASVYSGVDALVGLMAGIREACPQAIHVLVGYSQGAEVMRRALSPGGIDDGDDIAAVVLIADPQFDAAFAGSGVNLRGDHSTSRHGVRRSSSALAPAPGVAPRTFSLCNGGDIVCQFSYRRLPVGIFDWRNGRAVHEAYGPDELDPIVRADVWPLLIERIEVERLGRFVLLPF